MEPQHQHTRATTSNALDLNEQQTINRYLYDLHVNSTDVSNNESEFIYALSTYLRT